MWHLRKEMPFRRHQHYQSTNEPRVTSYTPLLREQFQAASAPYAKAWSSSWIGWDQRNRQEYCIKDTEWQVEAQSGTI